jgi:hypothetical protein
MPLLVSSGTLSAVQLVQRLLLRALPVGGACGGAAVRVLMHIIIYPVGGIARGNIGSEGGSLCGVVYTILVDIINNNSVKQISLCSVLVSAGYVVAFFKIGSGYVSAPLKRLRRNYVGGP